MPKAVYSCAEPVREARNNKIGAMISQIVAIDFSSNDMRIDRKGR